MREYIEERDIRIYVRNARGRRRKKEVSIRKRVERLSDVLFGVWGYYDLCRWKSEYVSRIYA